MNDKRGTMNAECDGLRLTADGPKRAECSLLVACDRQFDYAVRIDADRDV